MSIQGYSSDPGDHISARADGVIAINRCVRLKEVENGELICAYPSAAKDVLLGVTSEASTASGDRIDIQISGISRVEVSEAVSINAPLMAYDTVGRANDPTSDGWASGDGLLGTSLEAATASGDIISARLHMQEIMP